MRKDQTGFQRTLQKIQERCSSLWTPFRFTEHDKRRASNEQKPYLQSSEIVY